MEVGTCECEQTDPLSSRLGLKNKTRPNECPGYDTKQSDGEVPVMLELWGNVEYPFISIAPGPFWPGMVAPDKGPIYELNRTNGILILN